jgi:hypothetical protein
MSNLRISWRLQHKYHRKVRAWRVVPPHVIRPLPRAGKADKVALRAIPPDGTGLVYPNTRLVASGLLPCATDGMRCERESNEISYRQ